MKPLNNSNRYKGFQIKFSSKVTWSEDLRSIDFNYLIRSEIGLEIRYDGAMTESVRDRRSNARCCCCIVSHSSIVSRPCSIHFQRDSKVKAAKDHGKKFRSKLKYWTKFFEIIQLWISPSLIRSLQSLKDMAKDTKLPFWGLFKYIILKGIVWRLRFSLNFSKIFWFREIMYSRLFWQDRPLSPLKPITPQMTWNLVEKYKVQCCRSIRIQDNLYLINMTVILMTSYTNLQKFEQYF